MIYDVGEFFHNGRVHIVLLKNKHIYIRVHPYFIKNISRTSAVSSTNFRSILIFASCVVGTCNMCRYNCDFFFFGHISSCSHLCPKRRVGHNSTVGLTLPEVWARSVQCVARGKPLKLFWPWANLRQIPGFPQHPPRGLDFCIPYPLSHPLSPRTHVKFGCKPGFSARRRGYTFLSLFLHRAPRYDPAAQQQSSPLAAACNCVRVWLRL